MKRIEAMIDLIPESKFQRLAWRVAGVILCALIAAATGADRAHAVVELNITQGNIQPLPIAIPDFTSDGSIDAKAAREISDVVTNDLKLSGLFLPIDPVAFIEKGTRRRSRPAFRGLAAAQCPGGGCWQNR